MTGLGGDQGCFDRLEIAHFADEYDVGVLTQTAAKSFRKRARIDIDLALCDKRQPCPYAEIRSGPRS